MRANGRAKSMMDKDRVAFWKETQKSANSTVPSTTKIDGSVILLRCGNVIMKHYLTLLENKTILTFCYVEH